MAYIVMVHMVMAYIGMAYIGMTYVVMAYVVIGPCSDGLCSYGPVRSSNSRTSRRTSPTRCLHGTATSSCVLTTTSRHLIAYYHLWPISFMAYIVMAYIVMVHIVIVPGPVSEASNDDINTAEW